MIRPSRSVVSKILHASSRYSSFTAGLPKGGDRLRVVEVLLRINIHALKAVDHMQVGIEADTAVVLTNTSLRNMKKPPVSI